MTEEEALEARVYLHLTPLTREEEVGAQEDIHQQVPMKEEKIYAVMIIDLSRRLIMVIIISILAQEIIEEMEKKMGLIS